jgi:hypothetical protein
MRSLLLAALIGMCSACATSGESKLTDEQVCRNHYENDPVERDRCSLKGDLKKGAPPQARPQDLPIRTGQPGGK